MVSNHSQAVIVTSRLKLYIDGELQVQSLKHPSKFTTYGHSVNDSSAIEPKRLPIFLKDPLFKNCNIQPSRLKSYINGDKTIEDLIRSSKNVRFPPEVVKQRQQRMKISKDDSTPDHFTDAESRSEQIIDRPLDKLETQVPSDNAILDKNTNPFQESVAQRRLGRDNRKLDQTAPRHTYPSLSEQNTSSDQTEAQESEPSALFGTFNNMCATSDQYLQRKNIKLMSVTDTLDTRYYESLTVTDQYYAENNQSVPMDVASAKLRYKNGRSKRDSSTTMNYHHKVKYSPHDPSRESKKHRSSIMKLNEKIETMEKSKTLQIEVNLLTEKNRNLDVQLQREQEQNNILQLSLQCLKVRAESKIDEITKNFNQISEKLKEAQNDLLVVKNDFNSDLKEKQTLSPTVTRLEDDNSQLKSQARYCSQKLSQKLSRITDTTAVLQERRNRLLKAIQNNESSYLLNDDLLGLL